MELRITWYTDDLRDQVIRMFADEYGVDPVSFNQLFERFYFHSFQKQKCLLIVALDGNTVAGFQSFFYWPYFLDGKAINSFQSGNSLVNPAYRGKGLFNKMLAFIDEQNKTKGIDLLVGFPVEASLRNFLKDKWENILNLQWYVKACNPFGFFGSGPGSAFEKGCRYLSKPSTLPGILALSQESEFSSWRASYLAGSYHSYSYKQDAKEIIFHCKSNKRKKILNELVIGNILFSSPEAKQHLAAALKALNAAARKSFGVHFLSLAINEACAFDLKPELAGAGFKRSDKSIYFIVKSFGNTPFAHDPANWLLFRSDIDTW